jgi:hypothetical protein
MRNDAPESAATSTPATASGERVQASLGIRRGASGVSGCCSRVSVSGSSAAQHSIASSV